MAADFGPRVLQHSDAMDFCVLMHGREMPSVEYLVVPPFASLPAANLFFETCSRVFPRLTRLEVPPGATFFVTLPTICFPGVTTVIVHASLVALSTLARHPCIFPSLRQLIVTADEDTSSRGLTSAIRSILVSHRCITHLSAAQSGVGLTSGMAAALRRIEVLDLSGCALHTAASLGRLARLEAPALRILDLSQSLCLDDDAAQGVLPAFEAAVWGAGLRELYLRDCCCTEGREPSHPGTRGRGLRKLLQALRVPQLEVLDVSCCSPSYCISPVFGVDVLGVFKSLDFPRLRRLCVGHVPTARWPDVFPVLECTFPLLVDLDIAGGYLASDTLASSLTAFKRRHPGLRRLGLRRVNLLDQGAVIAGLVRRGGPLRELDSLDVEMCLLMVTDVVFILAAVADGGPRVQWQSNVHQCELEAIQHLVGSVTLKQTALFP